MLPKMDARYKHMFNLELYKHVGTLSRQLDAARLQPRLDPWEQLDRVEALVSEFSNTKQRLAGDDELSLNYCIPRLDLVMLIHKIYLLLKDLADQVEGVMGSNSSFEFKELSGFTKITLEKSLVVLSRFEKSYEKIFPKKLHLAWLEDKTSSEDLVHHVDNMERWTLKIGCRCIYVYLTVSIKRIEFMRKLMTLTLGQILSDCPDDVCGICLAPLSEEMDFYIFSNCRHIFCSSCMSFYIDYDLVLRCVCPMCRQVPMHHVTSVYIKNNVGKLCKTSKGTLEPNDHEYF